MTAAILSERGRKRKSGEPGLYARADAMDELLAQVRAEYEALLASWEYAYAMGDRNNDHPRYAGVRQRALDLRARIQELTAESS
jgi:hypothetical protein